MENSVERAAACSGFFYFQCFPISRTGLHGHFVKGDCRWEILPWKLGIQNWRNIKLIWTTMEDKFAGAHSCQTQNLRGFIPQLCATISGGSRALCKVCGLFCFGRTTFALYVCVHHGDMFGVPANFHLATTYLAALLNAVCAWSCRQQNAIPLNAIAGTMVCWHPIMFEILLKSPSHSKQPRDSGTDFHGIHKATWARTNIPQKLWKLALGEAIFNHYQHYILLHILHAWNTLHTLHTYPRTCI